MKKAYKRVASVVAALSVLVIIFTITVNSHVESRTRALIYEDVDSVPHNRVALLLGTNPLNRQGRPNTYFVNRIDIAARLYHLGKVDFIIASGDNHSEEYDEPTAMRDSLVAHGVPENRIILDFAGFRTLDSVIRSKDIFGCDSLTIISQKDHCARALYLAEANGISAVAVAAPIKAGRFVRTRLTMREWLARDKMMLDIWSGKRPHFSGDKIEIPAYQRQKSYSSAPGITLEILNIDDIREPLDSIHIKIGNRTDSVVSYGEWFEIQTLADGEWQELSIDDRYQGNDSVIYIVWNSIAYILYPHTDHNKIEKPWFYGKNLVAGHYRLAKDLFVGENNPKKDTVYVEFDLR